MGRIALVAVEPGLIGLFSPAAWRALGAGTVLVAERDHPALPALDAAGVGWEAAGPRLAEVALDRAMAGDVTVLLTPGQAADPELCAGGVGRGVLVEPVSSGAPKGAGLLELVAVETRLRGPGGCPWDHDQTHASLARHLVEEAYETLDAIEDGSAEHLREELGDVLLQVVFHAQIDEDVGGFDIDDVAAAVVDKLVRRHPHVFGDRQVSGAGEVIANWEAIKREQEGRTDPLEGIPRGLPALQLAAKLQRRAAGEGFGWPLGATPAAKVREELGEVLTATGDAEHEWEVGDLLFAAVALARAVGVEPESALRAAARRFRDRFAAARSAALAAGAEPRELDPEARAEYWRAAKSAGAATAPAGGKQDASSAPGR